MDEIENAGEQDVAVISDEDLDKQLSEPVEVSEEAEPEKVDNQENPEKPAESVKDEENKFSTPDEEILFLKSKLDSIAKSNKDRDDWIKRRDLEIGQLRKRIEEGEVSSGGISKLNETFYDDPVKGVNDILEIREKEKNLKSLKEQEQEVLNKLNIMQVVPNYDELVEDMAAMAKEDGEPPELIELFKKNPYALRHDLAINYARRANDRKKSSDTSKKIADLEKKINDLRTKPDSIIDKINDLSRKKPVSSTPGSTSGSRSSDDLSDSDIASISDAELEEILKKI